MNKNYEFPALNGSLEGSAWHKWSMDGAICAYENQNINYEKEAENYAKEKAESNSRRTVIVKAFLFGVANNKKLKRINP